MISCTVIWNESNLAFTQDIVFHEEVYEPGLNNTLKYLPRVTVQTEASVVVGIKFISTFVIWCN